MIRSAMRTSVGIAAALLVAVLAGSSGQSVRASEAAPKNAGRWALLIGVDDYLWARGLEYCGADMRALSSQLVASGFPSSHVFLLHDKAPENKYRPTKASIEAHLRLVLGLVEKDDLVMVGFSGHGVHLNGRSYLCPAEARLEDPHSLISVNDVYAALQNSAAALKLFLVDACRNDPRLEGERSLVPTTGTRQFAQALERPPQGILLFASCAPGEIAREDKEFSHGVFMHYFLEGLGGAADANGNGRVSLMELYLYVNDKTKSYVARKFVESQHPSLKGEIHDDFDITRVILPGITNAKLVLADDFDAADPTALPLFDERSMTFRHAGREGQLTRTASGVLPVVYEKPKFGDFTADFDFRVANPAGGSYGLLFRSADIIHGGLSSYYALLVCPSKDQMQLLCWDQPRWAFAKTYPLKPGLFLAGQRNHVHLDVVKNRFQAALNDSVVFELRDETLAGPGIIGLCAVPADSKQDAVYFSNLRIRAPTQRE